MVIFICQYIEINIILLMGSVIFHCSHHLIIQILFNTLFIVSYGLGMESLFSRSERDK